MAIIHNTTMNPGKLDLLAVWLPAQPWYRQTGQEPELARAGELSLRINRVLEPGDSLSEAGLSAPWRLPDGTRVRGVFATAR